MRATTRGDSHVSASSIPNDPLSFGLGVVGLRYRGGVDGEAAQGVGRAVGVAFNREGIMHGKRDIVVFRQWRERDGGDIIALFPLIKTNPQGLILSYQHVGQHGAANYQHVIGRTVQPYTVGVEALKRELTGIGYNLDVRKRRPSWRQERRIGTIV